LVIIISGKYGEVFGVIKTTTSVKAYNLVEVAGIK
jgi:hypothetical protein